MRTSSQADAREPEPGPHQTGAQTPGDVARDANGEVLAQDAVGGSPGDADLEKTEHQPSGARSEDD